MYTIQETEDGYTLVPGTDVSGNGGGIVRFFAGLDEGGTDDFIACVENKLSNYLKVLAGRETFHQIENFTKVETMQNFPIAEVRQLLVFQITVPKAVKDAWHLNKPENAETFTRELAAILFSCLTGANQGQAMLVDETANQVYSHRIIDEKQTVNDDEVTFSITKKQGSGV